MTTNKNKIIFASCVLLAFLGLCLSSYYAWQEGLISPAIIRSHPSAPLPENFLRSLQESINIQKALPSACLHLNTYTRREIDWVGRSGLQYYDMSGWGVTTIAQIPGENGQRIGDITQAFEALSKIGLYKVNNAVSEDINGQKVPARSYSLTVEGWKNKLDQHCLKIGDQKIIEIVEYSRILPNRDGQQVYEVTAKYAPQHIPKWLNDPAVVAFVSQHEINQALEPRTVKFHLTRTNGGWSPVNQVPELSKEIILSLVDAWHSNIRPRACIKLLSKSTIPNVEVILAPYSITFFEPDKLGEKGRLESTTQWQSRLSELAKAGLFKQEDFSGNIKLKSRAGTKFTIEPDYQAFLDMNDASCLSMGKTTAELVDLSIRAAPNVSITESFSTKAVAKFLLRINPGAWIHTAQLSLPEIDAIREAGGLPMTVNLTWDKEKKWQITSVQVPSNDPIPSRSRQNYSSIQSSNGAPDAPAFVATVPTQSNSIKKGDSPLVSPQHTPFPIPPTNGEDVTWLWSTEPSLSGRVSNQGLTVTYCCAGASSATLASRGITKGKVYAEFIFTARPHALTGDTWTTIGVIPVAAGQERRSHHVHPNTPTVVFGHRDEIAHNDVIGIAIDLDAGKLFISRNGSWLNGAPGSGGVPLKVGQAYYIVAVLSASSSSTGTDSWTANFGKTNFRYPIPPGFKSYDGRQRG